MDADARPGRRARLPRCSLTPSPPMSRSASPERPPRDVATPRFAQLDLITNDRTARVYVVPDHTYGETWPGRQRPTKQLSLFESGVAKRQSAKAKAARARGEEGCDAATSRRRRRKQSEPPDDQG